MRRRPLYKNFSRIILVAQIIIFRGSILLQKNSSFLSSSNILSPHNERFEKRTLLIRTIRGQIIHSSDKKKKIKKT